MYLLFIMRPRRYHEKGPSGIDSFLWALFRKRICCVVLVSLSMMVPTQGPHKSPLGNWVLGVVEVSCVLNGQRAPMVTCKIANVNIPISAIALIPSN